jgi:predicted Fe-S protein YdhL (DUF1289 family)
MSKTPSPCIDVCKYRRQGHCIACSMTKPQKKLFKSIKRDDQRRAFVDMLAAQMQVMGRYKHWPASYLKKCRKKGVTPPSRVQQS